jgi:hypothetical protein
MVANVFFLLDNAIRVVGVSDDFSLRVMDGSHDIIRRNTTGDIKAGKYMIRKLHSIYFACFGVYRITEPDDPKAEILRRYL